MRILVWEEIEKAMPIEEWKEISADGAPPGVYAPNMSDEDAMKWRAKLTGTRRGNPQVEIRKRGLIDGALAVIIVSLGDGIMKPGRWSPFAKSGFLERTKSAGINVAISLNGTFCLTWDGWVEMSYAIDEATRVLQDIKRHYADVSTYQSSED